MKLEFKIGKEDLDWFFLIYYGYTIILSLVVISLFELSIIWWVLFIGIIPFLITKLTKIKIRRLK